MRIFLFIRKMVVATVDGYPQCWRELQGARSKDGKGAFKPKWARETTVRDEPVEADVDSKRAEQEGADGEECDARPTEEPWQKGKHGKRMAEHKANQGIGLTVKYPHCAPHWPIAIEQVVWRRMLIRLLCRPPQVPTKFGQTRPYAGNRDATRLIRITGVRNSGSGFFHKVRDLSTLPVMEADPYSKPFPR
jgi:hypothetical protein